MSDLISRSELLVNVAHRNALDVIPGADFEKIWLYSTVQLDMFNIVKAAPAVDAVPVVHARWEPHKDGVMLGCTAYRCSACGRVEEENGEPYCHCGAKMDGGAEE